MCGIVAYIGDRKAIPILIKGLERLEYRGYDSAGIGLHTGSKIEIFKKKGKVEKLRKLTDSEIENEHTLGIAHTRWATHGEPNDSNSHPHASQSGTIVLVHNGIIENYATIKAALEQRGYTFQSQTDTEVISNLIEEIKKTEKVSILEAVKLALTKLVGAYGLAILDAEEPDQLIVARKGSPLVVGIGDKEFFVASDATPIVEYTKAVMYLDDGDIAILRRDGTYEITDSKNNIRNPEIQKLDLDLEAIEKGGFESFMLKEIYEQPKAIRDSIRGRLNINNKSVVLGGIKDHEQKLLNAKRIIFVACGTSWHAALIGKYFIEELARIPVEVEYASEFRYRDPVIKTDDVVIAISQSGETADTLAALELAKTRGATILGICNVVGSSIARITDAGIYTHAGPEIGVASTKAFTTQLSVLLLLALRLSHKNKNLSQGRFEELIEELNKIPEYIEQVLTDKDKMFKLAESLKDVSSMFYLGRGVGFPTALEGALKLKEISYIHAEGYPAAEMKHGPIALIYNHVPVICIATEGKLMEKVLSNMQEVRARHGRVIAVSTKGDKAPYSVTEEVIEIPKTDELLTPFIATIPLQLLAYQIAILRGCNVDKPRNLAKSVTVE